MTSYSGELHSMKGEEVAYLALRYLYTRAQTLATLLHPVVQVTTEVDAATLVRTELGLLLKVLTEFAQRGWESGHDSDEVRAYWTQVVTVFTNERPSGFWVAPRTRYAWEAVLSAVSCRFLLQDNYAVHFGMLALLTGRSADSVRTLARLGELPHLGNSVPVEAARAWLQKYDVPGV